MPYGTPAPAALLLAGVVAALAPARAPAQDAAAPIERRAEDGRLVSDGDPAIEVRLPPEAAYVGNRSLIINDVYDAELHVFVEADAHGLVERFYWLQFESILSAAPDRRYDYRETEPLTLSFDGVELLARPGGSNTREEAVRPGTDHAAFRALLDEGGYRLPTWITTLRLVHLFEPTERKEFILIYGEGPDALAEAAAEAMAAGEPGVRFEDMLGDLVADVDARVDLLPRD